MTSKSLSTNKTSIVAESETKVDLGSQAVSTSQVSSSGKSCAQAIVLANQSIELQGEKFAVSEAEGADGDD